MPYIFTNVKVLVVDDNQPMINLTKSILQTFGVGQIFTALNGEDAIKKYKETNPDIIIADWMMKPINGIDMTKKIRSDDQSINPYVPVILMTGFSEKKRVFEARDAGVTEFLVKPFNARDLYRRLVQIIERPRQFVRSDDFFGPDRRRIKGDHYNGAKKRYDDYGEEQISNVDLMLKERND